ncbi:unnamed protein product [Paramecium pentaurelia]|uniref:Mur ligase C-terminal domain-containing protein n=2 Tax=Paramecium pentaurelia TaxID=43138 RepID=A0A8S1TQ35_9CILI|nr:unnamed protein product [Paramecium pentaurelia]
MNYKQLYEEMVEKYQQMEEEYNQFVEESQSLEDQQQKNIESLSKQLAQAQNSLLQQKEETQKARNELQQIQNQLEKQINKKDAQIAELQKTLQTYKMQIIDLEVDQDLNDNKIRQLEESNKDLEVKLDKVLEQLALAHTDLEASKSSSQEEIERLKQTLKENEDELTAAKCLKINITTTPEIVKMPKIDSLRANAAGFNKSLTLIQALIKDLDDKMSLIRHQKKDRATLTNIIKMTQLLGNPQQNLQFIHIAGTNGKGSVTLKMCKLMQSIESCGCYTSPHISSFRERIKVDNQMISEEYVQEHLNDFFNLAERNNLELTFFEYVTCLALKYFNDMNLKYVSWETGLGGRMDSTNIISSPLISIITTIGYDHMHILGNTLELIAKEKAGIIKQNCPVVIGPKSKPYEIFIKEAQQKNADLTIVQGEFQDFNDENNAIVMAASKILMEKYQFKLNNFEEVLKIKQPCRLEQFNIQNDKGDNIKVYLDVGHNEQAIKSVLDLLKDQKIICIYGASNDKDITSCLQLLKQNCHQVYMVQAKNNRAYQIKQLLGSDEIKILYDGDISKTTLEIVNKVCQIDQVILVIGSFYIMDEVRMILKICQTQCDFK